MMYGRIPFLTEYPLLISIKYMDTIQLFDEAGLFQYCRFRKCIYLML